MSSFLDIFYTMVPGRKNTEGCLSYPVADKGGMLLTNFKFVPMIEEENEERIVL
jgi:hypothetical protein